MDDQNLLLLASKFRKLRDKVETLSVKQEEIQTIKGDQGPKGEQGDRGFDGAPGKDGDDGADGTNGQDGKDGVSVVNAEISFDGSLVIYLSDGREIDCGYVVKETGDTVIQTLKQGAAVSGGGGITSITSTDGSVVITTVGGVVDLAINVFNSTTKGLVPASGGGTTNFLRADGTFAAPPAATPASPTTSVQFNNAGAFGGSANFTYNTGTNTLNVGPANATSVIRAANTAAVSTVGGQITLQSGNGTFTGTTGGTTIVKGGDGTTVGGTGGSIQMNGGVGYTNGGNVELAAGFAFSGSENGANFTATGGQRNVSGGDLIFESGGGNVGSGGGISFSAGTSANAAGGSINFALQGGATDDGEITFKNPAGETYAYFKNDGPGGAQQIGFFNATPVAKPAPTASGTQAVLDSVVSSLNSLGLVDSAALTNATVITPAGADTQIQYNAAGVLGASANFTFNSTTNTVTLGATTGTATYTTRIPTTAQNPIALVVAAQNSIRTAGTSPGGALTLRSGNGRPTGAGNGGALAITSGNAGTTGSGGAINITSGTGDTTSGSSGDINLFSGSGSRRSGIVSIIAGDAIDSPGYLRGIGGSFIGRSSGAQFQCGNGTFTDGGAVFFIGGTGDTGGNVSLSPGIGTITNGAVTLKNAFSNTVIEVAGASGAPTVGFFGAVPVVKPTVTGSRASGAALQNLLTQLAALGLITDSTTA